MPLISCTFIFCGNALVKLYSERPTFDLVARTSTIPFWNSSQALLACVAEATRDKGAVAGQHIKDAFERVRVLFAFCFFTWSNVSASDSWCRLTFQTYTFYQTGRNTYNFRGNYPFLHDHDPLVDPADGFGEQYLVD